MKEIFLKVEGMMCSGCENRVQNALKNIDGVGNVVADHITKVVKVTLQESIKENSIKECIEELGFEVIE